MSIGIFIYIIGFGLVVKGTVKAVSHYRKEKKDKKED